MKSSSTSLFTRYLLPGFAFKAVVIGGGYATGRELAEFFLSGGPWGGLLGLMLAMAIWSGLCALTFLFAHKVRAVEYRAFFIQLLGPAWVLFETTYLLLVILILAVFGAAAGAIGAALLGWPPLIGTLSLAGAIVISSLSGNASVEQLFKYVSFLLYAVYALFLILILVRFSDQIGTNFATATSIGDGWVQNSIAYAAYNIVGAVIILPVTRHLKTGREAVIAGLIAGPLAMVPAIAFFVSMIAFYPAIASETLPSDFMLKRLGFGWLELLFQLMIFCALWESGTGAVHAINERVAAAFARRGSTFGPRARGGLTAVLLVGCIFVADRVGLVALIGSGYRWLAYAILATFVLPLLTVGIARLVRNVPPAEAIDGQGAA